MSSKTKLHYRNNAEFSCYGTNNEVKALNFAGVAQLVEHHLAKVDVEGSNPFARSTKNILEPRFLSS